MSVRFATFNVENLFARPKVFSLPTWAAGQPILDAYSEFNSLIEHAVYSPADKARMIELLLLLEVYRLDNSVVHRNRVPDPAWAWLRANRGSFDVDHDTTGIEILAEGRTGWTGWLELAKAPTDETATRMTARVINDVAADALCVVEAEDRPSLDRFNRDLLGGQYGHAMLIDGNDPRGIDVGLLTTAQIDTVAMRSNVDVPDTTPGEHLFSRDCPEYQLRLPGGASVWVLLNHFKSKAGGRQRETEAAGARRAEHRGRSAGCRAANILVMGDLNDGPSAPGQPGDNLAPLFDPNGPLISAYDLPGFSTGPRPGTFQSCGLSNRIDHIFVSRALIPLVAGGSIERHGLWGTPTNKNRPTMWEAYPEITAAQQAASDHAAVPVDVNI
jgi:endonuclease/exonuclease/phosphatase family metal-dependent hydrolase